MNNDSGSSISVWMTTATIPSQSTLASDVDVDVCVVGAGIAGMTTAYLLAREGKSVAVLDDGPIGGGETGRTTAHLTHALDDRYYEMEPLHGAEGAALAAESHTAAIDLIEKIVTEEKIDCEFERLDGYLFAQPSESTDELNDELEAVIRAGLGDVRKIDRAPIDSFDTGPCLHFPQQAQFHPMKYLAGLARAIARDGGRIFTGSHVESVEGGTPARVKTSDGATVTARAVVVATNTPINDRFVIHTKQAAYRTYVIGARVPLGSVPRMLLWDTSDPYHYIRLQTVRPEEGGGDAAHDILIVGGEDHKTGQESEPRERFDCLEAWTRERFPQIERIEFRWSGQIMEPVDGLAFIGRNPMDDDNVYVITGDSGNGMTHGSLAGILITDLIAGRPNRWAKIYDPGRITLGALPEFLKEGANTVAQYADWVTPGDDGELPARGEGMVERRGLTKVAVYRDNDGAVHELSAVCTHLGCIVAWNGVEKSWDCPCHGSRFDAHGRVLNGPAVSPLEPIEKEEHADGE